VLPDHHGQGIGAALMTRAIDIARSKGWTSLRIESDPHAQALYEHMGASQIGRVAVPVAGHERFLPLLQLPLV
jgi:GNAT superfamily N-acetyltransferase